MEAEKKVMKFEVEEKEKESDEIKVELASAMLESKRLKRLIDFFFFALFLLLVSYFLL